MVGEFEFFGQQDDFLDSVKAVKSLRELHGIVGEKIRLLKNKRQI